MPGPIRIWSLSGSPFGQNLRRHRLVDDRLLQVLSGIVPLGETLGPRSNGILQAVEIAPGDGVGSWRRPVKVIVSFGTAHDIEDQAKARPPAAAH